MSFTGPRAPATGHLQSLGLLCQAACLPIMSPSTGQGFWPLRDPGPGTLISSSGLWLPSHTQLILLWPSDLESFPERITVNMGAGGRNRAVIWEGARSHTHHIQWRHAHMHTHSQTLWILREEKKLPERTHEAP